MQAQVTSSPDGALKSNPSGKKKFGIDRIISFFKTSAANLIIDQSNQPPSHSNSNESSFGNNNNNNNISARSDSPTTQLSASQKSAETSLNSLDLNELSLSTYPAVEGSKPENRMQMIDDTQSPRLEIDLNEIRLKFSKSSNSSNGSRKGFDEFPLKRIIGSNQLDSSAELSEFYLADSEWDDLNTRNIAFTAVIYDEFIKELAAICQEHSVLTQEQI